MVGVIKSRAGLAFLAVLLLAVGVAAFSFERFAGAVGINALGVSDTVYGIDAENPRVLRIAPDGQIVAEAPLPEHPARIWFVGGGDSGIARVITWGFTSNRILSFDATDLSDKRETTIDIRPMLVSPSPDRRHIAIAETGPGTVILLDAVTLDEVGRIDGIEGAHDLRFGPDGDYLYVSTLGASTLSAIRIADFEITDEVHFSGFEYGVDHMSRTPDGALGFAVSPVSRFVEPVRLGSDLTALPRVDLPSRPFRALVGPRGENAWFLSQEDTELYRLGLGAGDTLPAPETIALSGVPRTLAPEPFADTQLVATFSGVERVGVAEGVLEHLATDNPVRLILPMEGAALSLLLHEDGTLSRQHAHAPLALEALDLPRLFAVTGANDLAFCHG